MSTAVAPDAPALPRRTTARPRRLPSSVLTGLLFALALIALAVVGVHDLLVRLDAVQDTEWVTAALNWADGIVPGAGWVTIAVIAALLGLWILLLALLPAKTGHLAADEQRLDVWLDPSAVAAMARDAADRCPGVIGAEANLRGRRRITVAVTTNRDAATVRTDTQRAVDEAVGEWTPAKVRVITKEVPR